VRDVDDDQVVDPSHDHAQNGRCDAPVSNPVGPATGECIQLFMPSEDWKKSGRSLAS